MAIVTHATKTFHSSNKMITTIWDEGDEGYEQPLQIDEFNGGVNLQQAANKVYLPDCLIKPLIIELRDYLKRTAEPTP